MQNLSAPKNNGHQGSTAIARYAALCDKTVAEIKKVLTGLKSDPFKMSAIQAVQALDLTTHHNRLEGLQVLLACISCYGKGDLCAARILMYVSGAVVEDVLSHALLKTIEIAMVPSVSGTDRQSLA